MRRIRLACPEDAAELLEIYRPYVEHTSVSFETAVPNLAEFRQRIADTLENFPYLVAEENGQILGYAYAHPFHARAAYCWTVESSVYVRQDLRRTGVGRALYQRLFQLLKYQGVRMVCAVITVPNEPSMSFHEDMGFEIGGILPDFGYKLGHWHGVAYFYLRLKQKRTEPAPLVLLPDVDHNKLGPWTIK